MAAFRTKIQRVRSCITTVSTTRSLFSTAANGNYPIQWTAAMGNSHRNPRDPHSLMKEDPMQVCSDLWIRTFSDAKRKPYPNLTGFLSKFDLWILAYQLSSAQATGSFPPRNAIQTHVLGNLLDLRDAVVRGRFAWNCKKQIYLRAPNEPPLSSLSRRKLRRLMSSAAPCFQDRVVQEILLLILEPVFEARFSPKSHAFRPGRNPHSAIRTIRSNFSGYLWFLKGDLREIAGDMDPTVPMRCLQTAVGDRRVLRLIRSALKSPQGIDPEEKKTDEKRSKRKKILKANEPKPDPYWLRAFFDFAPDEASEIPSYGSCGILSPLLCNVCFDELDRWMEDHVIATADGGCHNPSWPEFVPCIGGENARRIDYLRYGEHFLIGIRGAREEAVRTRKELIEFCENAYGFRLDNSKIRIEHVSRGIEFLDHVIYRRLIYPTLRYTATGGEIVSRKAPGTLLSVTASLGLCIRRFRMLRLVKGDRDPEPLPCTPMLYSGQAHTNSQMNKFLETMADWYRYADNRKKIVGFCAYVIRSSLAKMYAARYKLKSRARVYTIARRDLSRPLVESSRNSAPEYTDLLRMGLADKITGIQFAQASLIPSCDYTPFPKNWIPEHEQFLREYIKLQDPKFFVQLFRSIKKDGLDPPQEDIANIVWDYKTAGLPATEIKYL